MFLGAIYVLRDRIAGGGVIQIISCVKQSFYHFNCVHSLGAEC